jgi:hypothetical protein
MQIVLTDENMSPLSERLVFNVNPARMVSAAVSTDKSFYGRRERIEAGLGVTSADGEPLAGSFSVAVTDDRYVDQDGETDIFSTMLLASELRGHIESPAYYFRDTDNKKLFELDLLLMTQGWSRYGIGSVLSGDPQLLPGYIELGPVLSGSIKGGYWLTRAGKGFPVSLVSIEPLLFYETMTDSLGNFSFDLPETPDGTTFMVQGKNSKGSKYVELFVDGEEFPLPGFSMPHPIATREDVSEQDKYMQRADEKYIAENGMRLIEIESISVTGRYTRPPERHATYPDFFFSGKTFDEKDTIFAASGDVESFLLMNNFKPGEYDLRIDGILESPEKLKQFHKEDLAEIVLLKGSEAYFHGKGGLRSEDLSLAMPASSTPSSGFGASVNLSKTVLISTKKGFNTPLKEYDLNKKVVTPLGYTPVKEFYSPRYETPQEINSTTPDIRTTIYWNPNVVTDAAGNAVFDFYSADTASSYTLVIEGITADGRPVYSRRTIRVDK